MEPNLEELDLDQLWALFARMADPDGVPAVARDPREREKLRRMDAGFYVADRRECASRRLLLTPMPGEIPMVELPGDPELEAVSPSH